MILSRHPYCRVRRDLDWYAFKLSAGVVTGQLSHREAMAWAHDMLSAVAFLSCGAENLS